MTIDKKSKTKKNRCSKIEKLNNKICKKCIKLEHCEAIQHHHDVVWHLRFCRNKITRSTCKKQRDSQWLWLCDKYSSHISPCLAVISVLSFYCCKQNCAQRNLRVSFPIFFYDSHAVAFFYEAPANWGLWGCFKPQHHAWKHCRNVTITKKPLWILSNLVRWKVCFKVEWKNV